jgi:hypothetical protein
MVPLPHFHYSQPYPAGLTRRAVSIPALPSAAWVRRVVAGGGCIIMAAKIMGGAPPCKQTRHRGRVNSSALGCRRGQSSAMLTLADVAETRQPPTACRSTPRPGLIEELVYSVVCMRRGFSRIRRQIGKLRESQMSLIGAEACRMNAACTLGLCVAGLRGQLRKLPFGVSACYAGLAPPVVHLG